jgi:hypothetical protein
MPAAAEESPAAQNGGGGVDASSSAAKDDVHDGALLSHPHVEEPHFPEYPDGSPLFESNGSKQQKPFFYYEQSPHGDTSFLISRQSVQHDRRSMYENYGTTLWLIIILHIIHFYQWNKRYSKQDVCTNYEQLVEKKQYYRAVVAVFSHPPVNGERGVIRHHSNDNSNITNETSSTSVNYNGNADATVATTGISRFIPCLTFIHRFIQSVRRIKQQYVDLLLRPLLSGSLSGLPLLAFCSHILWQCRALEELFNNYEGSVIGRAVEDNVDGIEEIQTIAIRVQKADEDASSSRMVPDDYAYFRMLVTLSLTALLLELGYLRSTLRRIDQTIDYDNSRNSPRNLLRRRSMGSLGSLCAALLSVYDSHFPYTHVPVVPFVRLSFISNSVFSHTFLIFILFLLCHRMHSLMSVVCGLFSGALWSLQITSFLATKYWGDRMLWALFIAILFSLKANTTYSRLLSTVIPCLDHVAWNRDGEIVGAAAYDVPNQGGRNSPDVDLEMGNRSSRSNGGNRTNEQLPLLSQSVSTMSGSSSTIRGRVPRIDSIDSS